MKKNIFHNNNYLEIDIPEEIYFYNSFTDLSRKFDSSQNNEKSLKEFLIEEFTKYWGKLTNQHTILKEEHKENISIPVDYLPIYSYSFHIIFENENDGILTFYYEPNFYNHEEKVYHSLKEIEKSINSLAERKGAFTLIIQKGNPKYKPLNNTDYQLAKILVA